MQRTEPYVSSGVEAVAKTWSKLLMSPRVDQAGWNRLRNMPEDFYVHLSRPGSRVMYRKLKRGK
eukprot:9805008-Alexandrium_andersonii.AAC.1